jgi:hypothetical protein
MLQSLEIIVFIPLMVSLIEWMATIFVGVLMHFI